LHGPGRALLLPSPPIALLAARAAGKVILDGVFNDVKNVDGFAVEARQGREMGFDGKTLIHPSQVEPTNEAFAPSEADVEHAGEVIEAYEQAQAEGRGVVTVNGRMIEHLHVRDAQRILAFHDAITSR
ncbi:MAG: HpcH/HpaI aldolase/citrate lyase family protein, partial [Aeromicrobium sp.]